MPKIYGLPDPIKWHLGQPHKHCRIRSAAPSARAPPQHTYVGPTGGKHVTARAYTLPWPHSTGAPGSLAAAAALAGRRAAAAPGRRPAAAAALQPRPERRYQRACLAPRERGRQLRRGAAGRRRRVGGREQARRVGRAQRRRVQRLAHLELRARGAQ